MSYLILSDIHANLAALEAVLDAAPPSSFAGVLVLGDLVGYGADPNAVVDRIRDIAPAIMIRGNHDKVACGLEPPEGFNAAARDAALWTLATLRPDNRDYLAALPAGPRTTVDGIEVCHGSPADEDAYIFDPSDARVALAAASERMCFFGHTHVQIAYVLARTSLRVIGPSSGDETLIELDADARCLINPGSVGQPRDGDPRAAYAIADAEAGVLWLRRVPYDVAASQARIAEVGLPDVLGRRLSVGL
jgi:predicted phosphodiesterase